MAEPEVGLLETLDERAGFARGPVMGAAPASIDLPAGRTPPAVPLVPPAERALAFAGALPADAAHLRLAVVAALATELERGTPFLFIPVFLAAGALVYFAAGSEPAFATIGVS